ncbi:hypothetical protein PsorP6_001737 [Peronosclerospora sorghi]|uniref:Uncharacterized protein n=1 Tax=Peronosclerospora sorghi TaxID=230839 RepID=A0ACC0WQ18_9STRA|nr:hypothetical protein PsorP6_001737 [Peronosclerospora sorghi]
MGILHGPSMSRATLNWLQTVVSSTSTLTGIVSPATLGLAASGIGGIIGGTGNPPVDATKSGGLPRCRASKVLGTLLVEQDSDTIIVYGDDDRHYPPQLSERVLYYTHKYSNDAIAVLRGWISVEDRFYCGRSLEVALNSVSFVGGADATICEGKCARYV